MHYVIIIVAIAAIVGIQLYIWRNTAVLIQNYQNLFKGVNFKTKRYMGHRTKRINERGLVNATNL